MIQGPLIINFGDHNLKTRHLTYVKLEEKLRKLERAKAHVLLLILQEKYSSGSSTSNF